MANKAHLYPATAERDYMRGLLSMAKEVHAETKRRIAETQILRTDAWSDDLTVLIEGLMLFAANPMGFQVARLPDRYLAVNRFNDKQWILQVKAGTGIDIPPSGQIPLGATLFGSVSNPQQIRARFGMGVDVYRSEPWLVPLRDNWIAENTRLIKSIPEQYLGDVEGIIRRGVAQGLSSRDLAKQIESRFDVSERRAKVIARDQISKANSQLTEHRQKDLGVTEYIWESSDDARVRPSHNAADGKRYKWSETPKVTGGYHPGQDILCRCWARSVWPDTPDE